MSDHITPLFSRYLSPCSSSPLLSPSTCLLYLTSSLSLCLPLSVTHSLHRSTSHYLSLFSSAAFLLILRPLIHPSPLPLTVIIRPVLSSIHFSIFLLHSLLPPVPLSLPPLFHFPWRLIKLMAILISCSSFKRGMT